MRYAIGDTVLIRPDLSETERYGLERYDGEPNDGDFFIRAIDNMMQYAGQEAHIVGINELLNSYILDIDNGDYQWVDDMLVPDFQRDEGEVVECELDDIKAILNL